MGCSDLKPTSCGGSRKPFLSTLGCTNVMHFEGLTNISVNQGMSVDLVSGVHAFDSLGEEIPFTFTPSVLDTCVVGTHTITYSATGQGMDLLPYLCGKNAHENTVCDDITITKTRTVTVVAVGDPVINGADTLTVEANEDFSPLQGITAEDGNGIAIVPTYTGTYEESVGGLVHYTSDGIYTITYTATDSCGNSTTVDRTVRVGTESLHTTLFNDGTLIINESSFDRAGNEAIHGAMKSEFSPLSDLTPYVYTSASSRPWHMYRLQITSVEFGSDIYPTSIAHWFEECTSLETIDTTHLHITSDCTSFASAFRQCTSLETVDTSDWDTSGVTTMSQMFGVSDDTTVMSLTTLDVSGWDTSQVTDMSRMFCGCHYLWVDVSGWDVSNVTDMSYLFSRCKALVVLDLSGWDTSSVTNMQSMFAGSYDNPMYKLVQILASENFVTSQVTNSTNMFANMSSNLVGCAGTVWSDSNPLDKTYARIDDPPSNPGYFCTLP